MFKKMEKIVKEGGMGDRRAGRRVNKDTTMREIHTSFAEQKHREQQAEAGLKLVEAWAITRPI